MGALFRSQEMTLCQLFLQSEAAYNSISEIGELGLVQFRDLNPDVNAFQRKFVHEVRRCDEMERRLRFFEREIKQDEIPMLELSNTPEAPPPREMIELEATLEKLEQELKEVLTNSEALRKTFLELTELKHILQKAQYFFNEVEGLSSGSFNDDVALIAHQETELSSRKGAMQLSFVTGTITRDRLMMFERMLWRVCRGNVFMKTSDIETPTENPLNPDEPILKTVFIIYFQGEQLKSRVRKICEGCRAVIYPCPQESEDRREMIMGVSSRLEDLNTVINQTLDLRHRILVSNSRNIRVWFTKVRKTKAIYHTLNSFNFDVTQKALIGECWVADKDMVRVRSALKRGSQPTGSLDSILNKMETKESPPTFHRTNKFTSGFQAIVDAYGAANYLEVNPAPFTIITFPFLFALMFGDCGHGLIMFLAALYLVLKEQKIIALRSRNEIFVTFFDGRYIVLLMGIFSMYTGLLYNDVFAKSLNIFGSKWRASNDSAAHIQLNPAIQYDGEPYAFGIDPIWQASGNKILFLNSYKMKLSVIMGVGQMLFGTILSLFNHTYFKRSINIWCEFVPQVIFLMAIFGYMNGLIIAKWITYDSEHSSCAPSILITLINMFMLKYPTEPCNLAPIYSAQQTVQTILMVLALVCVPWMLFVKPFILQSQAKKRKVAAAFRAPRTLSVPGPVNEGRAENNGDALGQHASTSNGGSASGSKQMDKMQPEVDKEPVVRLQLEHEEEEEEEEFQMAEVLIESAIHAIEYCLGSISHTASYLRLWALSLAHAQLSEVLWNMVMQPGLKMTGFLGPIVMFAVFAFWAVLTVSVLLLMEGLSAFLHALRLHWVEFQSKFYKGEGRLFEPLSFKLILDAAAAED